MNFGWPDEILAICKGYAICKVWVLKIWQSQDPPAILGDAAGRGCKLQQEYQF